MQNVVGPEARPSAETSVKSLRFRECDQFSEHIKRTNHTMMQLSGGSFEASMIRAEIPGAVIYNNRYQGTTLSSAVGSMDHIWMLQPLRWKGELTYNGQAVDEGDVAFYGPGGVHSTKGTDKDVLGVAFDRGAMERALAALTQADPPAMTGLSAVLRVPGALSVQSRGLMQSLVNTLTHEPENLANPAAAFALTQCLQTMLLNTLEAASPAKTLRSARTAVSQSKVLRRAAEYLEANSGTNVYVSALCESTGVSIRSLEKIFRSHFGMPAMRYLKLQRLHQARKMLRDPSSGIDSVKAASLTCGFWELGRFAGEYRTLFGELPSETLARRAGGRSRQDRDVEEMARAFAH